MIANRQLPIADRQCPPRTAAETVELARSLAAPATLTLYLQTIRERRAQTVFEPIAPAKPIDLEIEDQPLNPS